MFSFCSAMLGLPVLGSPWCFCMELLQLASWLAHALPLQQNAMQVFRPVTGTDDSAEAHKTIAHAQVSMQAKTGAVAVLPDVQGTGRWG